jgi:hypothetical protein
MKGSQTGAADVSNLGQVKQQITRTGLKSGPSLRFKLLKRVGVNYIADDVKDSDRDPSLLLRNRNLKFRSHCQSLLKIR